MVKACLLFVDGRGMKPDELMHPMFSDARLQKIARRNAENLLIDSACAELAFLAAQKTAFGKIEKNLYFYGDNDKPYFKDKKYGFLSLAHASSVGVCMIAPVRCGCDAENKTRDVSAIDSKIKFCKAPEPENPLTVWCVKESYVKLTGDGLLTPFSQLQFKDNKISDETGKCLAWAKTGEIECLRWAAALEKEADIKQAFLSAREAIRMIEKEAASK